MTRDELISYLDVLKDYYLYPESVSKELKMDTPSWFRNNYTAIGDVRIQNMLKLSCPSKEERRSTFSDSTFAIVSNMVPYINIPSDRQLLEMLQICEYNADDMLQYIAAEDSPSICAIPTRGHIRVVYLLSRAFYDAITDDEAWKTEKQLATSPQPLQYPAMDRLKALIAYMKENGLLKVDKEKVTSEYDDFLKNYSVYTCMGFIFTEELKIYNARIREKLQAQRRTLDKTARKAVKRETVTAAKYGRAPRAKVIDIQPSNQSNPAPSSPSSPAPSSSVLDPAVFGPSATPNSNYAESINVYIGLDNNAPECVKREQAKLITLCNKFSRATELAEGKRKRYYEERKELNDKTMFESDVSAVSAGFLNAFLEGDTLYRTSLGMVMYYHLLDMSRAPVPSVLFSALDDADEWDHRDPAKNKALTTPIIQEDDRIQVSEIAGVDCDLPISLMSFLSRYASRHLENSLSIRNSLVQRLEDMGLSKQKAHDCAVIVATAESIARIELSDYTTFARYPKLEDFIINGSFTELEPEQEPEQPMDERVEIEVHRREMAERDLRQAQKENKSYRHDINVLKREIARLEAELAGKPKNDTIPQVEDDSIPNEVESACDDAQGGFDCECFPYYTGKKVVVYGGFESFHADLLKLIPDVRIVEMAAHIDLNPIRNADIVFIQTNMTSHSAYWMVSDACKNSGVPIYHLSCASPKRCAVEMVGELERRKQLSAG